MPQLSQTRLILFFTRGISLQTWEEIGIIDREIETYKSLLPFVESISFLTYGSKEDFAFASRLDGINILPNKWRLGSNLFSLVAPILYRKEMQQATILKTNQTNGWWTAGIARMLFKKKLVVRCGFLLSLNYRRKGHHRLKCALVSRLELLGFKVADKIVVATENMKDYIARHYALPRDKIAVIPNHVNTDVFKPLPGIHREPGRICFVGTLKRAKNLSLLLQAMRDIRGVELVVIGSGPLRDELTKEAKELSIDVRFLGSLPNYQLPTELNRSEIFVLPSLYEGHPKALLEAMACGLPVIGTDVPGIREVIAHGQTGYLCQPTPEDMRRAITRVLGHKELGRQLGERAREFVVESYSIEKILEQELTVLHSLMVRSSPLVAERNN
jgi:glycosyltransferase involved in cell wall biosynthesis